MAADFIRQAYHKSIIGMALGPYFVPLSGTPKGKKRRHGRASNGNAFALPAKTLAAILQQGYCQSGAFFMKNNAKQSFSIVEFDDEGWAAFKALEALQSHPVKNC